MDLVLILPLGILFGCFLALSWLAGSDAPYIPTKEEDIPTILRLGKIKQGTVLYELGSGDGRVVLSAAQAGAISKGIEQSWLRIWFSRFKTKKLGLKNTNFFHGNIFDRQYLDADVVYVYLLPKAVEKLEKKFQEELKKGSLVITNTYHFKNWKPFKKEGGLWAYQR